MVFAGFDCHLRCKKFAAFYFGGGNRPAFEAQFTQLGLDGAQVGAGINQGAENHVAADTGKAVEVCVACAFHWMVWRESRRNAKKRY